MTPGYTEFSYGFGLIENLIRGNVRALPQAPIFPNLVQEANLGYDVELGLPLSPLFLQFKLAEVMKRTNAKEAHSSSFGNLTPIYYRMPIMRRDRSDQHARLIHHEGQFPDRVFYVVGCMPDLSAFNHAFVAGDVPGQSAYFSPTSMGQLQDNDQHKVIYKPWSTFGWFCTEPRETPAKRFKSLDGIIRAGFDEPDFQDPRKVAQLLHDSVVKNVNPVLQEWEVNVRAAFRDRIVRAIDGRAPLSPEQSEVAENLVVAHRLARVGLGLELVIAQPKP